MVTSNIQKFGMAALCLGSVFAAATPAMALERGCQNADLVRAALKEEGQFVLVSGERPVPGRPKNIFTSNERGDLGYNIEQGQPGELCVGIKYTDIHVNKRSDLSVPSWASRGTNTPHDQYLLRQAARSNDRVVLGATVLRQVGSDEVRGAFMMVTRGNAPAGYSGTSGAITITLDSGEIRPGIGLANVEPVHPNYEQFANRQSTP